MLRTDAHCRASKRKMNENIRVLVVNLNQLKCGKLELSNWRILQVFSIWICYKKLSFTFRNAVGIRSLTRTYRDMGGRWRYSVPTWHIHSWNNSVWRRFWKNTFRQRQEHILAKKSNVGNSLQKSKLHIFFENFQKILTVKTGISTLLLKIVLFAVVQIK